MKKQKNHIWTLACALVLLLLTAANLPGAIDIRGFEVTPTVLFKAGTDGLQQRLDVTLDNSGSGESGLLRVRLNGRDLTQTIGPIQPGKGTYAAYIPEITKPVELQFMLQAGNREWKKRLKLFPQRKWTVYLFHHSHTDLGYTDLQNRVRRKHAEYLDQVIHYCRETENYPDDARFRWNCEVSWGLENYIQQRSEYQVRELIDLIRQGRVEVSGMYLNVSDMFAHEELIRSIAQGKALGRRYGFDVHAAMNDDVTGFSWAIPQILSQCGIRYFATGINETRSRAPLRRPNPFYWESADGSKVLHWNGEHYLFANYDLRLHEPLASSQPRLVAYLGNLQQRGDYPYEDIAFNISGYVTDNCPPGRELSDRVREWNETWAFPRLRLATLSDFFTHFEKKYGGQIPTYKLGWPDYWTDGVASTAFETGVNRLAHDELIIAEKLATAVSEVDGNYAAYPGGDLAEAYRLAMLYDEHTWGGWNSIDDPDSEFARGQWAIKSSFAYQARELARNATNKALERFSRQIASDRRPALVVFNALSWERSDVVRLPLPETLIQAKGQFRLVDLKTGQAVPFQILDNRTLIFLAERVPPLGYKVYACDNQQPQAAAASTALQNKVVENGFYRITLDEASGSISSILDKETGMELVDKGAPFNFNQYIYENPVGGRPAVDNMAVRTSFNRSVPTAATLSAGWNGPVAFSLVSRAAALHTPRLEQQVILYDGLKRIDLVTSLEKEAVRIPEAVYFAFPFAGPKGQFLMEIADGAMRPESEQLPGTSRDWHTVQNWVEIAGAKGCLVWSPLEAPLLQFGDINTGKWLKKMDLPNSHLYSYAMNNYWMTNFKADQGGPFTFHYALTSRSGGSDLLRSSRFGWEVHTPLQGAWLPQDGGGTLPASGQSLLGCDQSNVIIQAWKRAEEGEGMVIRLREIAGHDTRFRLSSPFFKAAQLTVDLLDPSEGQTQTLQLPRDDLALTIRKFAILTVRIRNYR